MNKPTPDQMVPTVIAIGFAFVATIGAVNSFSTVAARAYAEGFPEHLAWTLPAGVDGAIATFSAAGLWRAYKGQPIAWVRPIVYALVAGTIFLNVSSAHGPWGYVAHGILPALWVISVELVERIVRDKTMAATATVRIPTVRWVLAPFSTATLYRSMRLWQVTDYGKALDLERRRRLTRGDMADRYGAITWRWKAPRKQRIQYQLGQLAPARTEPTQEAATPAVPELPVGGDMDEQVKFAKKLGTIKPDCLASAKKLAAEFRSNGRTLGNARAIEVLTALRSQP